MKTTKNKSIAFTPIGIAMIAVLTAASYGLSFLQMPIPFTPAFARFDLSDIPALIGSFVFGPLVGVLVELVKNLLGLITSGTGGVGELANFLIKASFVAVAGVIGRLKGGNLKFAILGCAVGSLVRGIVAALANYFILLPLFEGFMPLEQLIQAFGEMIPFIKTKLDIVLYNAFPVNVIQGILVSVVALLVYKPLSGLLKKLVNRE